MRGPRPHPFPHRSLNVGEPVAIDGRTVGREGIRGEAGRLGLAEVVVCPRYQRGQICRSVGIVGRLRLGAPLPEPGEQLLLGGRPDPVTRGIGAVASEHERNTRLVLGLVGGLGRLRDQLAVKDRRRLVGRSASPRLGRRAAKDLFGAEGAQFGQRGLVRALDPHRAREVRSRSSRPTPDSSDRRRPRASAAR